MGHVDFSAMRIRIKAKVPSGGAGDVWLGYPLTPKSFALSLGVHGIIILALLTVSLPATVAERPVYEELIKPNQHKIIFYDFRRKTPNVNPVKKFGRAHEPRGAELSRQAIIATSRRPKSSQVFISVPAPKIEIPLDIPAPLMIARLDTIPPVPPPPPQRIKPRQFVPPKPAKQAPKLPIPTPVLDLPAPAVTIPQVTSPVEMSQLTLPKVSLPPKKAPESTDVHHGNATADIAVASLHPAENAAARVPNGERPGKFSKAPTQGEASSGDANGRTALTVPDLTIRNAKPEAAPKIATESILYTERVRSIPMSTLSVPLRPSSRMIPPAVDAQFKGRNVYTIVIPMEHIPAYSGDWILWFADHAAKSGETPVVRAPVPFRKIEPVEQAAGGRTTQRILLTATLGRAGKLERVVLLTQTTTAIQHAVFDDVTSWQFQPATSDGVAVDIDVVLEIPFSLPAGVASNR